MRYKFIGTEQDLVANGFEIRGSYAIHDKKDLFIRLENKIIKNNHFMELKQEEVQDLIDEGLVEVIE